VRDELGLEVVELSLDLIEDFGGRAEDQVRSALDEYGLRAETVFTGLAAYSLNLLMHPDAERGGGRPPTGTSSSTWRRGSGRAGRAATSAR
jgi:hypothetical protein